VGAAQVGAGPAGLVLALSLLQNGVPVRIIDKLPKFPVGQRGSGIQVRSVYQLVISRPGRTESGSGLAVASFNGIVQDPRRLG
jgi:ribulose 1,5-bisphosphate synthetase/thiazole synthase